MSIGSDIQLALLGDSSAQKRITNLGIPLTCKCGTYPEVITWFKEGEKRKPAVVRCPRCHREKCLTDWNTRAPILSAEELKKLEETT